MKDYKFYISWLISSVLMFGLSYVWHGVFLNDIALLKYPLRIFLLAAVLSYLAIGFLITFWIYHYKPERQSYIKDLKIGGFVGVLIYLIAFVFGISFHTTLNINVILFDGGWQVVEQLIGGLAAGFAHRFLYTSEKLRSSSSS